jgi:hypothetical protein
VYGHCINQTVGAHLIGPVDEGFNAKVAILLPNEHWVAFKISLAKGRQVKVPFGNNATDNRIGNHISVQVFKRYQIDEPHRIFVCRATGIATATPNTVTLLPFINGEHRIGIPVVYDKQHSSTLLFGEDFPGRYQFACSVRPRQYQATGGIQPFEHTANFLGRQTDCDFLPETDRSFKPTIPYARDTILTPNIVSSLEASQERVEHRLNINVLLGNFIERSSRIIGYIGMNGNVNTATDNNPFNRLGVNSRRLQKQTRDFLSIQLDVIWPFVLNPRGIHEFCQSVA